MTGKCTGCDRPLGVGRFQAVEAADGRCTRCTESDYAGTPVVRTGPLDDGSCMSPKWCHERRGHGGEHRRYLNTLVVGRATVGLTLETRGKRRVPVVSVGNGEVVELVLTWEQVDQLSNMLYVAHRSYAWEGRSE